MRIVYTAILSRPIVLDDHWAVPFLGGEFRAVDEDGKTLAFELTFTNQPEAYAPLARRVDAGRTKMQITTRDQLLPFVRFQLEEALAFVRCYHEVEIRVDEIEAKYIGESVEEEARIEIKSWKQSRKVQTPEVYFDLFTRAIVAARSGPAPLFESTLLAAARAAFADARFIDSFRYSFLLVEATYGDGKFRTAQLTDALKSSNQLNAILREFLGNPVCSRSLGTSDTDRLVARNPTVDELIEHLVEKRGFYFHGNRKRALPWTPQRQDEAEALASMSLYVSMAIAHEAAAPLFLEELVDRHLEDATRAGAIVSLKVVHKYRQRYEEFDRDHELTFSVPGTKVTPRMAFQAARQFLNWFDDSVPAAQLKSAVCTEENTGDLVFEMKFHVAKAAAESKSEAQPE